MDHNASSVAHARARGLDAVTVSEFDERRYEEGSFDTLLLAHVVEHVPAIEAGPLVESYLRYLRPGGRVLIVCPQERGFASDPTHVTWTTGDDLVELAKGLGLAEARWRSFPLPRWAGRYFVYNEFRMHAVKP